MPRSSNPPNQLTPVVFHTLLALTDGSLHGYAISQRVEEVTEGQVKMGPGTLYGTLQRIQAAGYVDEVEPTKVSGPHVERRRYYALTRAGRSALKAEAIRLAKAVDLARSHAVLDNS